MKGNSAALLGVGLLGFMALAAYEATKARRLREYASDIERGSPRIEKPRELQELIDRMRATDQRAVMMLLHYQRRGNVAMSAHLTRLRQALARLMADLQRAGSVRDLPPDFNARLSASAEALNRISEMMARELQKPGIRAEEMV